jgi:hypothetical protein
MSISAAPSADYSAEYLAQELQSAEQALAALQNIDEHNSTSDTADLPPGMRLHRLTAETEDLSLMHAVTQWAQQKNAEDSSLLAQVDDCVRLGDLLRDRVNVASELFQAVYQQEYMPLAKYLSDSLLQMTRMGLQQAGYPSTEACARMYEDISMEDSACHRLGLQMQAWERLQESQNVTVNHVEGSPPVAGMDALVLELCRPLVERVDYHFCQVDKNRPTSTRLDRLAEWLFTYLKEKFFEEGPWEVIYYGWAPMMRRSDFGASVVNEIGRLVQWVVTSRNLFREPLSPTAICRTIEQVLQFDAYLQMLLPDTSRVISLTDSLVAGDEELFDWWLNRERENLHGQLASPTAKAIDDKGYMNPHTEVFGALIRSIRHKAALFTSQAYLQQVAGPLCMQFLDAVHEKATDLKEALLQSRQLPALEEWKENMQSWIELLNGTHWCVGIIMGEDDGTLIQEDDLMRFGRSLERLEDVLLTDLVETVVGETLLLQRARLGNYLMHCSQFLADPQQASRGLVSTDDLAVDLLATKDILSVLLETCQLVTSDQEMHLYAPRLLRDRVLTWVANKFLEALLDEGMVTEILAVGGSFVYKDVQLLFQDQTELPHSALRLLELTRALQDPQLATIGNTLCGLAAQPPPLTVALFELDERLFEEAVSMMRAKGWLWLELSDLLSVLNRRIDLSHPMAL